MELRVENLWNGEPADGSEAAWIRTSLDGDLMRIEVEATLHGDPPPRGAAGPFDGLWNHEVVELFIGGEGEEYLELEFGPHGHYLVLGLEGERNIVERCVMVSYRTTHAHGRWRGVGYLHLSLLPKGPHRGNAFAIHGVGEERRYLAWQPVPGEKPDFHQIDRFAPIRLFG